MRAGPEDGQEYSSKDFFARNCSFLLVSFTVVIVGNAFFQCFVSLRASRRIHDGVSPVLLRAPMQFFWANPAGRMVNRLAADLVTVDLEDMPPCMALFLFAFLMC